MSSEGGRRMHRSLKFGATMLLGQLAAGCASKTTISTDDTFPPGAPAMTARENTNDWYGGLREYPYEYGTRWARETSGVSNDTGSTYKYDREGRRFYYDQSGRRVYSSTPGSTFQTTGIQYYYD